MLSAQDVTEPGVYRYQDLIGGEPLQVEVLLDGLELIARFAPMDGDEGADLLLADLSGYFERVA